MYLENALPKAHQCMSDVLGRNSEEYQHAERLGSQDVASKRAVAYHQWSIAVERATFDKIVSDKQKNDFKKQNVTRGQMAQFESTSIAEHSTKHLCEHHIWLQKSDSAVMGEDLYSTLWASIEVMFTAVGQIRNQHLESGQVLFGLLQLLG